MPSVPVHPYNHPVFATNGNAMTSASQQKIDSGVIRRAGAIRTARFIGKPIAEAYTVFGSVVFQSIVNFHNQMFKALSAGTYNAQRARKFIIRRVTTELATVANTSILMGSQFSGRRSINYIQKTRAVYLRSWSIAPAANSDGPVAYSWTYGQRGSWDDLGADNAGQPTLAVPGEFTYKGPKPDPVNADYKPRTGV